MNEMENNDKKYTATSALLASFLLCSSAMANAEIVKGSMITEEYLTKLALDFNTAKHWSDDDDATKILKCKKKLATLKAVYIKILPSVMKITCTANGSLDRELIN